MGNRRKGDVWKYFRKVSQNAQGKAKVSCTFCGCTYLENATRMTTHLQKCSGYRKIHAIFSSDGSGQPGPSNYMAEEEPINYANSYPSGMIRHPFTDPLPHQSTPQESETRELLAKAIFACGLPPGLVEEPHWRALFKALDPNFVLPPVAQLERTYLETEYCDLKSKIDKRIYDCSCVGVVCNSSRNEDLLNVFVTTPKIFFHKTLPKLSNENRKEGSLSFLDTILHSLGKEKVVSIVTNRASGLLNCREFIEEKYSHIAVYQCLHESVCGLMNQLLLNSEHSKSIWKKLDELRSILSETPPDGVALPNPIIHYIASSRMYDMPILSYILSSKVVITDHIMSKEVEGDSERCKQFVSESNFWVSVEKLYHLIDPVAGVLRDLDTKSPPPLSHVVRILNSFMTHFETALSDPYYSSSERSSLLEMFQTFKDSLIHPIHLAADFLDPQSKGVSLSLKEQMMATEYIYKLAVFSKDINDEDLLVDLANYKACDELWGKEYVWKAVHKLHPVSWWNGFCSSTNLSKIAVRIFNLPATTLYEKSVFSSYEYYEGSENIVPVSQKVKEMLSYVSRNLKFLKEEIPDPPQSHKETHHSRIQTGSSSRRNEEMLCVPKTEKDQPHYENETFDGYHRYV